MFFLLLHFPNADLEKFMNISPNPSSKANDNDLIKPDFLKIEREGCQGYNLWARCPVAPVDVMALAGTAQSGREERAAETLRWDNGSTLMNRKRVCFQGHQLQTKAMSCLQRGTEAEMWIFKAKMSILDAGKTTLRPWFKKDT